MELDVMEEVKRQAVKTALEKIVRPRGTDNAKIIPVIVTEAIEGIGTNDDPVYMKKQYWDLDGNLLAIGENH